MAAAPLGGGVLKRSACQLALSVGGEGSFERSGAEIDGPYRYRLWRTWDPGKARVGFVMLNPSKANATTDDPTIRMCMGFARRWGFGGLDVANLFALISTDPKELLRATDPIGPRNDAALEWVFGRAVVLVAAWGVPGELANRAAKVRALLWSRHRRSFQVLGLTKAGYPKHPLRQSYSTPLQLWPQPSSLEVA